MAEKKLTKVQKEILETLRDNPEARVKFEWNNTYRLYIGGRRERTIIWDTWMFLRPWLKEEAKRDDFGRTLYTFRSGAEISDQWRTQEVERQRAEAQRKRDEENRRKEEEAQQSQARLRSMLTELESGNIAYMEISDYMIRFEYNGKWYQIREES